MRPFFLEAPPRKSDITFRVNVVGRCWKDLASVMMERDVRHIATAIGCINLILMSGCYNMLYSDASSGLQLVVELLSKEAVELVRHGQWLLHVDR